MKKIRIRDVGQIDHRQPFSLSLKGGERGFDDGTMAAETISNDFAPTIRTIPNFVSVALPIKISKNMEQMTSLSNLPELKGKKFRIRKLTPRECFRLFGVDEKDIDKIQASGLSDSAQYRCAGNSIVVDVLFNIFRTMFVEEDKPRQGDQLMLF